MFAYTDSENFVPDEMVRTHIVNDKTQKILSFTIIFNRSDLDYEEKNIKKRTIRKTECCLRALQKGENGNDTYACGNRAEAQAGCVIRLWQH